MIRPLTTVLAVGLLIMSAGSLSAGEETLDKLVETALRNNPSLRAAEFDEAASGFKAKASGVLPDPAVSVGLLNLPKSSLALDETPMSGLSIGLSQTIPWPGKLKAKSRMAGLSRQMDAATRQAVRNRLVRDVTDAYYEYSYWSLASEIINENITLIEATSEVTRERYAQGDASAHDALRVQTALSRLEIRLLKAERARQSAVVGLNQLVRDSLAVENLPPYLPDTWAGTPGADSIEANPVLLNANLAAVRAKAGRDLAKADYWPDFTLGVDYRIRKQSPGDPLAGENFLSFKVGVKVPLWFFARQKNESRASHQKLRASQERELAVRDVLTREVEDNQLDLDVLSKSLESYDSEIVPQAKASLEAAEIAYEVGGLDFNGYLAAQTELLDIQIERLELVREANRIRAYLAELTGNN